MQVTNIIASVLEKLQLEN